MKLRSDDTFEPALGVLAGGRRGAEGEGGARLSAREEVEITSKTRLCGPIVSSPRVETRG